MRIVVTHGRDQTFQIPATMARAWEDALRDGLQAVHYPHAADVAVDFAFYGDIWRPDRRELAAAGDERGGGERGSERGEIDLTTTLKERPSALTLSVAEEMLPPAAKADEERLDWNRLAQVISGLDDVLHVGRPLLTWFMKDLDEYFRDQKIRDRVLAAVRDKVKEVAAGGEPVLLLAHSMGTIVGYDLLATDGAGALDVGAFVTFGSPLGMASLRERVAELHPGTPYPAGLGAWTNAYNEKDFATVVRELADLYRTPGAPRIRDVPVLGRDPSLVDPGSGHDPIVYLSSIGLAQAVADLLGGSGPTAVLRRPSEPVSRGIEDAIVERDMAGPGAGRPPAREGPVSEQPEAVTRSWRAKPPRPADDEDRGGPARSAAKPPAPTLTPTPTPTPTRTVQRTASADFPPVVSPGTTHDLVMAISGEALFARETGPISIEAPVATRFIDLRVGVYAADFDIAAAGDPRRTFVSVTVDLDDANAVAEARFKLTAHKVDSRRDTVIYLTVYRGNLPIGQLNLVTAIDPVGDVRSAPLALGGAPAPDPDFVLVVTDTSQGVRGSGPFQVFVSKEGRYLNDPLGSFPVAVDAWDYAQKRLEGFRAVKDEPTPEDKIRRAEDIGVALWWDLPDDFHDFYWKELHDQDVSIAIYSQEPYIPWELVKPQRERGGEQAEFLGVSFRMARWKQALPFPDPLTVSGFSVIAPEYGPASGVRPLPAAQEEAKELVKEFGATIVPGDRASVRALLESDRGIQLIHFAGHGEYDPESKDDTVIRLSDQALVPLDINRATLGRTSRPLVFLNACEVGEQGWALTRIGGWAEAFCDVGFSGFVGPYWAVNDRVARKAANLYYSALSDGRTVGEALRDIRRQFYSDAEDRGHPSWLAYTLHCQPNVHVQMPAVVGAAGEPAATAAAGGGR